MILVNMILFDDKYLAKVLGMVFRLFANNNQLFIKIKFVDFGR